MLMAYIVVVRAVVMVMTAMVKVFEMTWEEFFLDTEACPEFILDRDDNVEPQKRRLF